MHVVRQDGHHYYVDDLVPGRAEGGLVAGEEPGVWVGAAHGALGLGGRVESEPFAALLEGRHPLSGHDLGNRRGPRGAAGYDLTFSAPKSVSLLHLLAPGELAAAVGAGHHAAVEGSLDYLGREGVGVRRTRKGVTAFLPSTGIVAGQFVHRTSRALDPHLHTHVVAANLAEGVDGAWSAVDSRRLFAHLGAAQALYHARLRLELGHRIGASWEVGPTGIGDVVGVDGGLRRLFSLRSASMDQYHFDRGVARGVAPSSAAFHADRPDKNRSVTVEELRSEWRRRATELGFDLGDLSRAVGPHHDRGAVPAIDRRAVIDRLAHLAEHRRTVARHHLVAVVASSAPGGADVTQVELLASGWLEAAGPPLDDVARGDRGRAGPDRRWEAAAVGRAVEGRSPTTPSPEEPPTDARRIPRRHRMASALGIDPPRRARDHPAAAPVMAMSDRSLGVDR